MSDRADVCEWYFLPNICADDCKTDIVYFTLSKLYIFDAAVLCFFIFFINVCGQQYLLWTHVNIVLFTANAMRFFSFSASIYTYLFRCNVYISNGCALDILYNRAIGALQYYFNWIKICSMILWSIFREHFKFLRPSQFWFSLLWMSFKNDKFQ